MGTTLGNLHIYAGTKVSITSLECFGHVVMRLSDGWISILDKAFQTNALEEAARQISKAVDAPLLSFQLFDDDLICLCLWQNGKCIAGHIMNEHTTTLLKGGAALAESFALNEEEMQRFRNILRCGDVQRKAELIEEFFGVALMIDTDFLQDSQDNFVRHRGWEMFDTYWAEQKRMNSIKNKTKAVLAQEIHAKIGGLGTIFLSYPDAQGIHPVNAAQPCFLQDGILKPLLGDEVLVSVHAKIFTNGQLATVMEPVFTHEKGASTLPTAAQYALGGRKVREFSCPEGLGHAVCMLKDGDLIYQRREKGESDDQEHSRLTRVATDGSIKWSILLKNVQVYMDPVEDGECIYTAAYSYRSGIHLHRLDFAGTIIGHAYFPGVQRVQFKHLRRGGFICVAHGFNPQKESCYSIVTLDDSFAIQAVFELPKDINPLIYSPFNGGILDKNEGKFYFAARNSKVAVLDLAAMQCRVEDSPNLYSLSCMDKGGLLYGQQGYSTVCVFDNNLRLVSRHRLKGKICCLQSTDAAVCAVTSAGDSCIWGWPEKCIVRVYRFEA